MRRFFLFFFLIFLSLETSRGTKRIVLIVLISIFTFEIFTKLLEAEKKLSSIFDSSTSDFREKEKNRNRATKWWSRGHVVKNGSV